MYSFFIELLLQSETLLVRFIPSIADEHGKEERRVVVKLLSRRGDRDARTDFRTGVNRLPTVLPYAPFTSLWEDRHLPSPSAGYGRTGLLALQAYQQQRYGVPLNFLDDWQNQIDHLLAQEETRQHQISSDVRDALLRQSA